MIPGLPDRRNYGVLSNLKPQQKYTLLRQLHNADRAGRHIDFRIGSPQLGLFSWAAPKDLPTDPSQRRLLITQPLHTYAYKDFQGQIYSPYGKGTVQKLEQSPIIILQNKDNKLQFTRADRRNAPVYTMIRTGNGNWITTVKTADNPPVISSYKKQHFKNISLQQAAKLMDQGAVAVPKYDGTGALAQVTKNGIQVYGVRKDKNGNLIRYTDHIGGLRGLDIPSDLVGKVFRVEVAGQQNGKPISANMLSGLLNSTLQHNIETRKQNNINLYMLALALAGEKDDYTSPELDKLVTALNSQKLRSLPKLNKQQFQQQLKQMQQGTHPITQEGFVLHLSGKRPYKAKLIHDADVIIRDIFKADTDSDNRAGGFSYSLPTEDGKIGRDSKIVGRVGTGFSHEQLRDMLQHPQDYIGRVARIKAMSQYPSGAYRSPAFIAMRTQGD